MKPLLLCLMLTSCRDINGKLTWPLPPTKFSMIYEGIEISFAIQASSQAVQQATNNLLTIAGVPVATK